ncbi:hypothetical protein TREMEDRAFT_35192 [Tremella mesenterica DSM 1558]|uniref:uncharacterized protein n=1 Tax=Tremella mesenterica (strain ATCC 24925 / CBS 8224 / DSM 1558 / NBRC 9311 / NRRL Y-6157 / RJB 2259-6 / UBC 559-6) TaxID=578456 RepID=UPI00032D1260|nr:uncharacterized protein TREMEDRAFT_35192 [Tremella mesenterica DSM 1558]EIW66301.1 hypothetical protein TREMEDRAFT_35192 [Tremella mesenterica DSM 1558]
MDDQKPSEEWHQEAGDVDPTVVALAASYRPGTEEERKLVRKIDLRLLPCIWALYAMSFMDRGNIGNAKTGGLQADFGFNSNQYSIILLVFFVSYLIFEIPSNLILTRVRPSLYLSGLCIIWGAVAASMAATKNWKTLAVTRFVLGIVEAGFAPGIAYYLSSWYKKYEVATRFSIYYTAIAVAGAFSGLIAGLITQHLDGRRGIQGWQWLFIIEGVGSCFVGCFTWFIMPDWPTTTKFLSPEERLLAAQRLAYDGLANTQGAQERLGHWETVKMALGDWRSWVFVIMYMLCTGAQTIQYFVPTLVGALGWTGYQGQYHTIPLYACAFCCILGFCIWADYAQKKAIFITGLAFTAGTFFIIVVAVHNTKVQFAFMTLAFGMTYAVCALVLMWVPNVVAFPAEKRAVSIALVNGLGNSASIYGVFLWPAKDAPRYIPGFSATTVWMFLVGILAQVMNYLVNKYPLVAPDPEVVVQQEIEKQRAKGLIV